MTTLLVDARAPSASGLGRYLRESVVALSATGRFEEIVLAGPAFELDDLRGAMGCRSRVFDLSLGRHDPRIIVRWATIAAAVGRPHQSWFPHWSGSWRRAVGCSAPVTTIHDLIQLEGDGPRGAVRAAIVAPWMRRMIAESRVVITGSDHARERIIERFPVAPEKIVVIPHGVAPHLFTPADAPSSALKVFGIEGPYLLTVANKKPHKNLEMAIRVLARSVTTDPTLRLVLVGDRFPHLDRLRSFARELGVLDRLIDLASISDQSLALLYAHAEALLFPSRVEGFGLPVIEAMAAGAPVVAVDAPPIPSVVGGAGDIVPIDDDAAMCAAIERLRREADWRAERVAAGRARARQFTWERSAASLADLLCADESA